VDQRLVERLVDRGTQPVDVHAQRIGVGQFLAPDLLLEVLARHHRGTRLHQRLQQLQADRIQLDRVSGAGDHQGVEVVGEVRDLQHPALGALAAARQNFQPRGQFLQRERFGHVIVGARFEAGELLLERVARGQHQHRRVLVRLAAQLLADLDAVHPGQGQVEHDHVELVDHGEMQAGHAVTGKIDDVPAVFQVVADIGGDVVVVLDHQHAHGHSRRRASSRRWQA
jgi:hypothetical protein